MFGKLFSRKPEKLEQKSTTLNNGKYAIRFLGDITGDVAATDLLRLEITKILSEIPLIKNAWFSMVKYADEEQKRLALILECNHLSNDLGHTLAVKCSEVTSLDILPSTNISTKDLDLVKKQSKALYQSGNKLFVVPILIERGENEHMPIDWKQAIQLYIVAEGDMLLALNRAVAEVQIQKFKMVSIFKSKILGVEPDAWWNDFVLDRWVNEKDKFPSQTSVNALVRTGGLIRTICMEWNDDGENLSFQ